MRKTFYVLATAAIGTFFTTSCVTQKRYDDLNSKKLGLEVEASECKEKLSGLEAENERLNAQVSSLSKEAESLKTDTTHTGIVLRKTLNNYEALHESYEMLLRNHERLKQNSNSENSRLSTDLARQQKDLLESQDKIHALQADLEAREMRVKELEKVLADKEAAVNALKTKVSAALLGFKDSDLKVEVKNGKVYVSLSEKLLFKSGSTEVDPKGVDALKKLAAALKDQDDLRVMVEGHTDDVPMAKGTAGIKDNWDLSVLRATSIVRILADGGVSPQQVIPSGRGEYSPVELGKSREARQKNRRTEIILTPKLDELFKILDSE